jgi:anaerobic magnesium-protoporphyrin IX monomethyl ester cyclase
MNPEVLFVNLPPHESYYAQGVPHLGMLYVLTALRNHGYSAGYLDCAGNSTRRDDVLRAIEDAAPKLVGFSVDTDSIYNITAFTRSLRKRLPDTRIILGGPASQAQSQEMMEQSAADVVVIGEGEHTACEVSDVLLRGLGSLDDVAGICYRASDGSYKRTTDRSPIENLDSLNFPDRSFLSKDRRYEASIISGRGCPFRCTFCFEGRMGNRYRHRSAANIVAEIESLVERYGRPFVMLNDDTFTADVAHTREFCRLLRQKFRPWKDLLMFCEVRADILIRHLDLIDELVDSGVARIQLGVESGSRAVLKDYKRLNVKPEVVETVVGRFHKAGIPSIYCGFIAGGPNESLETFEETTAFAKHLLTNVAPGSFECNMSFLTPLPGTELYHRPAQYGLRLLDPDLKTSTNFNMCVAESEALSSEQITDLRLQFVQNIESLMDGLLLTLPRSVLDRHIAMRQEFGVGTRYAERMLRQDAWSEYWLFVGAYQGLEPASKLSDESILERFPTRLGNPARYAEGRAKIAQGLRTVELNRTATEIYKMSSGKLTTQAIVDELAKSVTENCPPREEMEADVITAIRSLEEKYLLYLKDY